MSTTQPADGAHITFDLTEYQRNMQKRIEAILTEGERLKATIRANSADYMALLAEYEAQRKLLQRVIAVDDACSGEAYAALIADVKAALEVEA